MWHNLTADPAKILIQLFIAEPVGVLSIVVYFVRIACTNSKSLIDKEMSAVASEHKWCCGGSFFWPIAYIPAWRLLLVVTCYMTWRISCWSRYCWVPVMLTHSIRILTGCSSS